MSSSPTQGTTDTKRKPLLYAEDGKAVEVESPSKDMTDKERVHEEPTQTNIDGDVRGTGSMSIEAKTSASTSMARDNQTEAISKPVDESKDSTSNGGGEVGGKVPYVSVLLPREGDSEATETIITEMVAEKGKKEPEKRDYKHLARLKKDLANQVRI